MTYPPTFNTPAPPQRPARAARRWPWIAGIVAALLVGIAIGAGSAEPRKDGQAASDQAVPSAAAGQAAPAASPAPTTTVAPEPVKPTPEQFTIAVKVIEKKCFGSAGCLITYTIDPQYIGTSPLPEETITVVYEVLGGDDPQTNRFKVADSKATMDGEETIQTPKSSSVLTAKVTAVL